MAKRSIESEKDDMTKNKELTIERIKEIIKEELRVELYEMRSGIYMSKADLVYVNLKYATIYVSLECEKKGYSLKIRKHRVTTEKELLDLVKKFKKVREMI